jgi:hypothetical protein
MMTKILSCAPQWDILEKFYTVFDKGRKCGYVEQWHKEMPKCRLEQELFITKIHTEFLNDRREKLNKDFCWTFTNMKKLITIDQRIRELNNEISHTFNNIKKDIAGLVAQNHKWYKKYELEAEICPANNWSIAGEHEYISDLLFWYANWDSINILANTNEDNHENHKAYNIPACKQMMLIDKFVEDGVTWELDTLLYDTDASLYSFWDIVRFRPKQFEVRYRLNF